MLNPLKYNRLLFLYQVLLFGSCWLLINSQNAHSQSVTSKIYHNLTARFNPYFIARQRLDSIENDIFISRKDNYNQVLQIIPLDTTTLKSYDKRLEDVMKKAFIIHNRHDESKLLDESYILAGKARFYRREFDKAIEVLKYVNVKGKTPTAQNRALINLLFIYTTLKDDKSISSVLSALNSRVFEDEKVEYYLMRGHYYRTQNDYLETAKSLGSAVLLMKKGEKRGRIYFILGQLYQKLGNDELAYQNFKEVIKNNPAYELAFYSQLYKAQVGGLAAGDLKKIKKYFNKLLTDTKNKEYQDKIYYEMALFELKQSQQQSAIAYLKKSLAVGNNPLQKGYTYMKLAEVNYAQLKNYEFAKMYYDSALTVFPKNAEEYATLEKRKKVLDEFVKHITTLKTEDSLQHLAKMPEEERLAYLDKVLTAQETRKQFVSDSLEKVREQQAKANKTRNVGTLEELNASKSAAWYFDNPSAIAKGTEEFRKKWGRRPLGDNWRLASKLSENQNNQPETPKVDPLVLREQTIKKNVAERKESIIKALPQKPEDFEASDKKIEEALYNLGKIYRFKLDEPQNSITSLENLLKKFPSTPYEAESFYVLYLAAKDLKNNELSEKYKNLLLSKHPNSNYSRIINDPEYYAKARANEDSVKAIYKKAYDRYDIGKFQEALSQIQRIRADFAQNLMDDKVTLLEYLIKFKIERNKGVFAQNLEGFKKSYPESPLLGYVDDVLKQLGQPSPQIEEMNEEGDN